MSLPRRTLERAFVAKLSDAREQLHDLVQRAARERAMAVDARGPCDPTDVRDVPEAQHG
jgi:hypothetical protein